MSNTNVGIKSSVDELNRLIKRAEKLSEVSSGALKGKLNSFIKNASAAVAKAAQLVDEKDDADEEKHEDKAPLSLDAPKSDHDHSDGEVDNEDVDEVRDIVEQVADEDLSDEEVEELVEEKADSSPGLKDFIDHEMHEDNMDMHGDKFKHTDVFTDTWGVEESKEAFEDASGNMALVHPSGKPSDNPSAWAQSEKNEIERETSEMKDKIMGTDKKAAKGKGIPLPKKIKQNPNAESSKVQVPEDGGKALKASAVEKEVLANGSYKIGNTEIRVNDDMEVELWNDGSGRVASLADMDVVISDFINIVDHKRKLEAASKFNYSTVTLVNVPCESCGEISAQEFTKNASYNCGCGHEIAADGVNALVKLGHLTMAYGIRAEHKSEKQFKRIASVLAAATETDADKNSVFAIYSSADEANEALAGLAGIGGMAIRASGEELSDLVRTWNSLKMKIDAAKSVLEDLEVEKKQLQNQMREGAGLAGQIGEKVVEVDGMLHKVVVRQKNNPSYAKALDEIKILFPDVERVASMIVEKHSTKSDIVEVKKARKVAFSDEMSMYAHELLGLLDQVIEVLESVDDGGEELVSGEQPADMAPSEDLDMGMRSAQLIPGAPLMQTGPKKKDDAEDEKSDEMPSDVPPSEAISAAFTNYKAQGMSMMKSIREFLKEHSAMVDSSSWSPSDDSAVISMLTKYWSGSQPAGMSTPGPELSGGDMPLMLQAQKVMEPKIRKQKDHVNVKKKPLGKDSAGEELLPLPSGKIKQQVKPQGKMPKTDLGKDTSSTEWNDPGTAAKSPKKFKMSDVVLGADTEGEEPFKTPALGSKPKSSR